MAGVAHDLLDRRSNFGLGEDGGVGFLSTHMPFLLKELSGGEEFRVAGRGADRSTDLAHRLAHGVEESTTGVTLHESVRLLRFRTAAAGNGETKTGWRLEFAANMRMTDGRR